MHINPKIQLTVLLLSICLASIIAFQKYYSVDRLFRDLGLRDLSDYQKSNRSQLALSLLNGKKLIVALVFGQSNSANFGNVRHQSKPGVYNLFENELYAAKDPLIGASGTGGSVRCSGAGEHGAFRRRGNGPPGRFCGDHFHRHGYPCSPLQRG